MKFKTLTRSGLLFLTIGFLAQGCSGDDGDNDAGVADTGGTTDTGSVDTGSPDGGSADTGSTDTGPADMGGGVDMGGTDAGPRVLVSIEAAPMTLNLAQGTSQMLTITGHYSDNFSEALRTGLTFTSSDDTVATVDANGVVLGVGTGTADIDVTIDALSVTVGVTVTDDGLLKVFDDDFGGGITFQEFGGSTNDFSVDTTVFNTGTASLKLEVPAAGYTGGAFVIDTAQDLSQYDAVTFWARASADLNLNVVGLGNDSANTTYQTELNAIPLTSTWTRFVVPIPLASRLTSEAGLFHFAEGSEDGAYTIWMDDIQYETLGSGVLGAAQPAIATETLSRLVGENFTVNGTSATFDVSGTPVTVSAAPSYFDYTSSDTNVVTVDAAGMGTAVAVGSADVTATLGGTAAAGTVTVIVQDAAVPLVGAPAPVDPQANVLSLFSDAYTPATTVDTYSAVWDSADVADFDINGDTTKQYTNLAFAGIEFTTAPLNVIAMTHFHIDVWTPNSTVFRVKLVDFGIDGAFGGGDDTEHELTFDATSTPPLVTGSWIQLDIPLTDFVNMTGRTNIAQIVLSGSTSTAFVDNIYFHR